MRNIRWSLELLKAGISGAVGAALALKFLQVDNFPLTGSLVERVKAAELYQPADIPIPSKPLILSAKPVAHVGLPLSSHLRVFDGYICSYDRRNRIPLWVLEHLTPEKLRDRHGVDQTEPVDRQQFDFYEDLGELDIFRSRNEDYLGSGYDRGHMAAAGNHRFDHNAVSQTFILSNIAPQVGYGFNRHAWNSLEKYVRSIARRVANVVVITGPLFLPKVDQGKKFVTYEVIGKGNVAVPTHFFKAVAFQEVPDGPWRVAAWVMPNIKLSEKVDLKAFQVPLSAVEQASGLKLFPNMPSAA